MLSLFLGLGLMCAGNANEAKAIIEKAVEARGTFPRPDTVLKFTGTSLQNDHKGSFVSYALVPKLGRSERNMVQDGNTINTAIVYNSGTSFILYNGQVLESTEPELSLIKDAMYRAEVCGLSCLSDEKRFSLSVLPETEVNGEQCHVLLAKSKGQEDVKLYFSKNSFLLLQSSMITSPMPGEPKAVVTELYSDHKKQNGYSCYRTKKGYVDGVLKRTEQVEKVEFLPLKDAQSLFDKPR